MQAKLNQRKEPALEASDITNTGCLDSQSRFDAQAHFEGGWEPIYDELIFYMKLFPAIGFLIAIISFLLTYLSCFGYG